MSVEIVSHGRWSLKATDSQGSVLVRAGAFLVQPMGCSGAEVPIPAAVWLKRSGLFERFLSDPLVQPFLYAAVTEGRIKAARTLALDADRRAFADVLKAHGLDPEEAETLARIRHKKR